MHASGKGQVSEHTDYLALESCNLDSPVPQSDMNVTCASMCMRSQGCQVSSRISAKLWSECIGNFVVRSHKSFLLLSITSRFRASSRYLQEEGLASCKLQLMEDKRDIYFDIPITWH